MPVWFTRAWQCRSLSLPTGARSPRGRRITKVDNNGLVIQSVSMATTQPAGATGVTFIMESSRRGLIAVFVLAFCVSARANSQHRANINHANHVLLFSRRWNVWLVSITTGSSASAAHLCLWLYGARVEALMLIRAATNYYFHYRLMRQLFSQLEQLILVCKVSENAHHGFPKPKLTYSVFLLYPTNSP